jgi:hypothetical protein
MDSWTLPNHKSYVAITVHLEHAGKACMMLLDLAEVAKLHTGVNLGIEFAKVLKNFSIQDKVSVSKILRDQRLLTSVADTQHHGR